MLHHVHAEQRHSVTVEAGRDHQHEGGDPDREPKRPPDGPVVPAASQSDDAPAIERGRDERHDDEDWDRLGVPGKQAWD